MRVKEHLRVLLIVSEQQMMNSVANGQWNRIGKKNHKNAKKPITSGSHWYLRSTCLFNK